MLVKLQIRFAIDRIITKIILEIMIQPCMHRHLYEYYSSVGRYGFLEHVSVKLIEKTDLSDPLKRENYLTRTI